jgi:hypothetical protein
MQVCSDHQIIAGCFSHSGDCIQTCENKADYGCWDAGMWGFVRECPVPRLSRPGVNEGWSNGKSNKSKPVVKEDIMTCAGRITFYITVGLLLFLVLCLLISHYINKS